MLNWKELILKFTVVWVTSIFFLAITRKVLGSLFALPLSILRWHSVFSSSFVGLSAIPIIRSWPLEGKDIHLSSVNFQSEIFNYLYSFSIPFQGFILSIQPRPCLLSLQSISLVSEKQTCLWQIRHFDYLFPFFLIANFLLFLSLLLCVLKRQLIYVFRINII